MGRNSRKILDPGDLEVARSHLEDLGHPVVDRASKKTTKAAAFWAGYDPGCLLAVDRMKKSQAERELHRLLAEVGRPARNLVAQGGSNLHQDSLVVAF